MKGIFIVVSVAGIVGSDGQALQTPTPPPIVRLWKDTRRIEQRALLGSFRSLQFEESRASGLRVRELALAAVQSFTASVPEFDVRVDIPSADTFSLILGVYRAAACSHSKKLRALELSADDIAKLIGRSSSVVKAALRWLGCGAIKYKGRHVADGFGFIHRARRTALAKLDGVLSRVYRTSRSVVTNLGRALLKLPIGEALDAARRKQDLKDSIKPSVQARNADRP